MAEFRVTRPRVTRRAEHAARLTNAGQAAPLTTVARLSVGRNHIASGYLRK